MAKNKKAAAKTATKPAPKTVNSDQLPVNSNTAAENKPSTDESLATSDLPLATNTADTDAKAENKPSTDESLAPNDSPLAPILKIEAGKTYFTKSNQFLKVLERDGDTVHYELYTLNNKKAVEGRITSTLEKLNGDILHLVDEKAELPAEATNSNIVPEGGENVFVKLANNQELRAVLFPGKLVFQDGKTVENPELAELIEKQLYRIRTY